MSAPTTDHPRPTALRKEGTEGLAIDWSDGHHGLHTWKNLRERCPCASCNEERAKPPDPFRILSAVDLEPKAPLAPVALIPIGHYAYKIVWNDGHDTGLYTIENLRAMCECPQCKKG